MTDTAPSTAAEVPAKTDAGTNGVGRFAQRLQNSAIPLGLKWSLSIATLIVVAMGLLGFYLIQHQEVAYREQADRYSAVIVDQLLRVSGEPLMAGDSLSLQLLLQRHVQNPLILGATLHDAEGKLQADAGVSPPHAGPPASAGDDLVAWEWENGEYHAVSYRSVVLYQDVAAGDLTVSFDRLPVEQRLRETLRFLVASTGLLISIGVLFAFVLAYRLSRPIERLARAGELLGAGRPSNGERRDEIGQVLETFQHLAAGYLRTTEAEAALSRYVSPQVAQHVLAAGPTRPLSGHRVTGSVLFCDIVGFTRISEQRDPGEVADLLNHYFGYFALAAESCNGTVDKFIGDAIMVVFGVPTEDPHHALHAITCGLLIQQLTTRINRRREDAGEATVRLRVGISSGPMLAGNLGSPDRMQYTVVGDTVNVAARLCAMSEPGGILLTESVLAGGQPGSLMNYRTLGPASLRGRAEDVEVRAMDVAAVAHEIDADRLIERIVSERAA
ncbi:MAG: adenylate/guanylate cyclase domain-containing protein [Chromatiaceae bacterium]|jgi:adenylate cyclase